MHTDSMPPEPDLLNQSTGIRDIPANSDSDQPSSTIVNAPQEPSATSTPLPPSGHRNSLKFSERTKLSLFLDTPDLRARAAKESDTLIATAATAALHFEVTPANITSMRRELGIEKLKPERSSPSEALAQDEQIALLTHRLENTTTLVHLLSGHISRLEVLLEYHLRDSAPPPDHLLAPFKDLQKTPLFYLPLRA